MKKVNHRNSMSRILGIALMITLAFSSSLFAQEGDVKAGEALFKANCAACHKLGAMSTGPMLRNIEARLAEEEGLDREWLYKWIKNSSAMIKAGDPYAVKTYEANGKRVMTAFPTLTNVEIDNILAYTAQEKVVLPLQLPIEGGVPTGSGGGFSNQMVLWALIVLFGLLAIGLLLVNKTLRKFAVANGSLIEKDEKGTPIWKAFAQNQFLVIITTIFFMLGSAYFAYGYLMQVGVDQGYQPIQPIHFSHKIHAGANKIECKYCHSSARVSKHSGIPSLNICMNCHMNINEYNGETSAKYSKAFYDNEIQKIYEATGWDPAVQDYVNEQKPVKWVRIHNLPDFVYFNHSQHVMVAGVDCQTCHGEIEEMEIVEQHSPLTMGWCINCHRETDVKVKGNAYYDKIHEQLKEKYGVESFKASQMGALECGKCHY
jgi:mono/diheme cytochrome c family protein